MGKFWWIVIIFLIIGGYLIKTGYDYNLKESQDQKSFALTFGKWVGKLAKNAWDVTGYAVKKQWLPKNNQTNVSNETK